MRVEKAHPAIVTKTQYSRVKNHRSSRAPKFSHPRRVGSSYLLSGLAKCKRCNTPLTGQFAQSGKYSYCVCQSNIKIGKGACKTPTLNARRFEEMVVAKVLDFVKSGGPHEGRGVRLLTVLDDCPRECLAFRAGCERNSVPRTWTSCTRSPTT